MAHVLIMPRQGNTVESCIIQEWKVKEGDAVGAETAVCVVETDKATFEVPAGAAGQVLKIVRPGGDDVPVLEPIAVIGAAGEDWQTALGGMGGEASPPASRLSCPSEGQDKLTSLPPSTRPLESGRTAPPAPPQAAPFQAAPSGGTAASPRARNLAAREGIDPASIAGTGPGGRVIERDVAAALTNRPPMTAAAKAAAGGGPLPAGGSGLGGRITTADLGDFTSNDSERYNPISETPVKGIRKLIADRMLASLSESAQFTLNAGAPAARLQELRKRFKTQGAGEDGLGLGKITVNDLVLYAVSRMLPAYPYMNALKTGDVLKTYERVHLGMAVDTPRGLMVPVIRNASLLSLRQISAEAKRLAAACQGGTVKPEELSGSTFTVSNLGSFGITGFTPVLNAPEVAILGVCGIELKPVEGDDDECGFAFEPRIGFSLTINHQVVDGAPAARFLKALCGAVADIDLLLAAQ